MARSKKTPSLDERITAAFSTGTASDTVAELIREAETAATIAGESAQHARERALDPALSAAEVEDAAFRRDRMQTAVAKLGERLLVLQGEERNQRRWLAYEKAKAERDGLAAELKDTYPTLAARLADLAARVDANDRDLARINTRALSS